MNQKPVRCWNTDNPLHIRYHDEEWGVPIHDDAKLFEFLVLGGFQAGLSWWLILERRDVFREVFNDFNPEKMADYRTKEIVSLMNNQQVIRNKAKILAAVNNANRLLEVREEFGSFDNYIWNFVQGKSINNVFVKPSDLPSQTEISVAMSREMRKRGFQFVGPTICYAFMEATGLANDHLVSCFRHKQILEEQLHQNLVSSGFKWRQKS